MKKKLVVLMAAVMMVSLAACGNSGSSDSKKEDTAKEETKGGSGDKLIVGTEAGFAPYEYMKGTEVVGIDMDIAKAIADDMGKELEIKNMDFDGALAAVQSGKVDMVAAGVSIDEERKQVMDFSDEYVDNTEVVVVNKDLEGKIVGVQQGNIADIWVANKDNANPKEIKRYSKFAQAVEDLKNGKIDGIIIDQYPAEEMVASNDTLTILNGTLFEDKYAIAVKKGNQELLDQINKVIKQLKDDGKIEEFTANHVGN